MKLIFHLSILILSIISISYEACIPGENCPYNQGECQDDQCLCKDGFYTLIDPSIEIIDQVFCDYEQISMKLMLLMEVLIPGSGQFYSKRWIHGVIKFSVFVAFVIISVVVKKKILIPKCFVIAKNALIGGGGDDEEKKEENNEDNNKNDNDNKKDTVVGFISDCMSLKSAKDIKFGGENTKKFCYLFSKIIIYIFWTIYSLDIYLIYFLIYSDGEGVPFSA